MTKEWKAVGHVGNIDQIDFFPPSPLLINGEEAEDLERRNIQQRAI